MEQIDPSKRKPRRTKGTPSYYYRNRVAAVAILAGSAIFALWQLTPLAQITNEKLRNLTAISEQEKDRKFLMNLHGAPRSSSAIKETIEERDKLFSER